MPFGASVTSVRRSILRISAIVDKNFAKVGGEVALQHCDITRLAASKIKAIGLQRFLDMFVGGGWGFPGERGPVTRRE